MPRWVAICQLCWEDQLPGDYFPEATLAQVVDRTRYGTCGMCGDDALVANVNPNELPVEYIGAPPRTCEGYGPVPEGGNS